MALRQPAGEPALVPGAAPCIVDAGARAAYVGPSFTLGRHRNAVAVLAVGLEAEFDFGERDDRRDARPLRHVLIPPGRWHWLDARGGAMGFLYLDACDAAWRALDAAMPIDGTALVAAFRRLPSASAPISHTWRALVDALDLPTPMPTDAGVADAMARVQRDPSRPHDVASHAARLGCAVSTFQRRFTAQAGLPWRRWRQWQRLRHAARAICDGADLTSAAHGRALPAARTSATCSARRSASRRADSSIGAWRGARSSTERSAIARATRLASGAVSRRGARAAAGRP